MGFFSRDNKTFSDLFVHMLRDNYYGENQIVKALPKMVEKATDGKLKKGYETHLKRPKTRSSSWSEFSHSTASM